MNGNLGSQTCEDAPIASPITGIKKKCKKCGQVKVLSEFHKQKGGKDGVRTTCKLCANETMLKWHYENIDKSKAYIKRWRTENKEQKNECSRIWWANHPDNARRIHKRAIAKRNSSTKGRLTHCISAGIRKSIVIGSKSGRRWETLVGYTFEMLKCHIEKQFDESMNWKNHGVVWHIDHKIPISAFNFTSPEDIDFRRCWALNNLQPLEAVKNMSKNNKVDILFQPCLQITTGKLAKKAIKFMKEADDVKFRAIEQEECEEARL